MGHRTTSHATAPARQGPRPRGFTLIELLIVVIILGIIAAIVIPRFEGTTGDAKLNAMTGDLAQIRRQLELYRMQHMGSYPTQVGLVAQLTTKTNADGTTAGSPTLGPYLNQMPINPFTGNNSVGVGAVGSSSWYYSESTGEFRANCHTAHVPY